MTIPREPVGFFSEHLAQNMARQGVTAKVLAIQVGCSYECVRKMVKTECLPSAGLLKRMAAAFNWNHKEARRLVAIDKGRRKFGRQFWITSGMNPDYEPIYILWYFLNEEEREYFADCLRCLVARKIKRQAELRTLSS
jgi:hypothetical protein